jgi:hypothetical protein
MMEESSPLMDETAPKEILDGILKVQQQQMKRAGLLQGSGGIWDSVGNGSDDSDEDIVVRTCARCFAQMNPCRRGRCSDWKKGQSFQIFPFSTVCSDLRLIRVCDLSHSGWKSSDLPSHRRSNCEGGSDVRDDHFGRLPHASAIHPQGSQY